MNNTLHIDEQLPALLDIARWAPSVHNAQPWRVEITSPDSLMVGIDKVHKPVEGDPTGRQTTISLGIFVEALTIAASSLELKAVNVEIKDESALLQFTKAPKSDNRGQIQLLCRRSSDRSVYTPVAITADMMHQLETTRTVQGLSIKAVTDKTVIEQIADLTSKGIAVAMSSPAFRKELSGFLVLPWSRKKRGIAVRSLYISWILEVFEPLLMRFGMGLKAEAKLEKRRWLSASAVVMIMADGDVPRYWFEVGRSYLQASLQIESMGLAQATSAAIVEASNYHEDIEELLGTHQRILALIRIGKGSKHRHYSPRVAVKDLLT